MAFTTSSLAQKDVESMAGVGVTRVEKVFASAAYLLMAATAGRSFVVSTTNPYRSQFQDFSLLLGAMPGGAVLMLLSAILVHFRPAKAYVVAMVALQLLALAYFPVVAPTLELLFHRTVSFSNYGFLGLVPVVLLSVIAVFTPIRLLKLVSH